MKYVGKFYFDRKSHAATCSIEEDNNIYVTIHEDDINGYKRKISGLAENSYITIYESRMVDHGVGYYKYQSKYATICSTRIKFGKSDLINNIYDFKFIFFPLNEWLGLKTIFIEGNNIKLEIPKEIILMENNISIKIKYFKEGIEETCEIAEIKNFKVVPYIVVKSIKKMSVNEVMNYIQLISRFFAILIGYTDNIRKIYFHNYINGKLKLDFIENILIINSNFSNKYDIRKGYNYLGLRTLYNDVKDKISILFSNWFEIYNKKEYNAPIIQYYSPYNGNALEEDFLIFSKILEKFSICNDDKKKDKKNKNKIKIVLKKFYKEYYSELVKLIKKEDLKKEYIKNIEEIHSSVIDSVLNNYDMRINLAQRIKKLDEYLVLEKYFDEGHVKNKTKVKNKLTVYGCIANTRNYYTHLDKNKNIIDEKHMSAYNRIMEMIIIKEMLKIIGFSKNEVDKIILKNQYLNLYNEM